MRVRARQVDPTTAPAALRPYLGQILVTAGKEYEVHAAVVFEGLVAMQVVDDLGYPNWEPAWLFDVVDSAIPGDWICSAFHDDPALVLGPDFIARSLDEYVAMVELDPQQVERFWNRVAGRPLKRDEEASD
jgi:hypothetical protein